MRNNNDEEYIKQVTAFYRKNRRIPTYAELMNITGYSSRASIFGLIKRLIDKNIFQKGSGGRLSPTTHFVNSLFARPKLGIVEAGFGYDADTITDDSHVIDEYLIDKPEATFLLTVKGESMIDAGIRPGDIVVAERGSEAKNGDIIIAEVDGSWTMKYYRNDAGKITLIPANRTIKPYSPKESFTITAVVKGVVRKYK